MYKDILYFIYIYVCAYVCIEFSKNDLTLNKFTNLHASQIPASDSCQGVTKGDANRERGMFCACMITMLFLLLNRIGQRVSFLPWSALAKSILKNFYLCLGSVTLQDCIKLVITLGEGIPLFEKSRVTEI